MAKGILGIHHVTVIAAEAMQNIAFCAHLLGLTTARILARAARRDLTSRQRCWQRHVRLIEPWEAGLCSGELHRHAHSVGSNLHIRQGKAIADENVRHQ
jgi:hypothetical protein